MKNSQVDAENQRESEAINNNIFERMEVSWVYTEINVLKRMKKMWSLAHQYLTFLMKLG